MSDLVKRLRSLDGLRCPTERELEAADRIEALGDLLAEVLTTLEHARKFVATREKMHPGGVKLYDETTCEVITALYAARALAEEQNK